jgi:hypothetical protein
LIATAMEGLTAAEEALRLSQERKEFGIAAVLERILAEQDLTRARDGHVSAIAEYDKAQYALLRAIGGIATSAVALRADFSFAETEPHRVLRPQSARTASRLPLVPARCSSPCGAGAGRRRARPPPERRLRLAETPIG